MKIMRKAGISGAVVLSLAAAAPAFGQLTVTGTENGTTPVTGPAFGSVLTLNAALADSFATQPTQPANSTSYNFVDVFTFTYQGSGGGTSGSAISFSSFTDPNNAITNLQGAVFSGSALTAGSHPGSAGDGPTLTGLSPVPGDAWTSVALGNGSYTTFSAPLTNGVTYDLEIRGEVSSAGGSYGGNITITSVPEPTSVSLLLLGVGALAVAAARRRRDRRA